MIQIGGKVPLAASGDSFAVATPHSAATAAAVASFHAGGNAVDAALAASVVLAVVYPHMCGPGGDLFAVLADGHTQAVVNGSGAAAAGVDAERIRRHHPTMPEFGALSVTVPGTVAAWVELAQRYGRLPLAAAIAPGVEHASRGIAVSMSLARAIVAHKARIERDSALRQTFAPGGHPLVVGDLLKLPALAATLRSVADEGAASFYHGRIGATLASHLSRLGSPITADDFREHATEVSRPIQRLYRNFQVVVPPPNSQGFVLLEILACIEQSGIPGACFDNKAGVIAELFLQASADRDRVLADPRRRPVPISELLSSSYDRFVRSQGRRSSRHRSGARRTSGDTVGIVVAEKRGLWVSINQSLYESFGSGLLEPETGVLYHNRGAAFSLEPSSANYLVGSMRPPHTLMPVIVLKDGNPVVASATMGGSAHAQIHTQILVGILDRHLPASSAVARPRGLVGGLERKIGRVIVAERRVPKGVLASLRASGFSVEMLDAWDERVGHAQLVCRLKEGDFSAASDPRADGGAAAY